MIFSTQVSSMGVSLIPWTCRDRWLAFWLSLIMPGAGQLRAGRWSCLTYFVAVAATVTTLPRPASGVVILGLGLVSAEQARRFVEASRWRGLAKSAEVRSRVVDRSGRGRRVSFRIELEVNRSIAEVWDLVADFAEFVTIDPFHSRVILLGPELRPGVEMAMEHRAFGLRFLRFGRLLTWREGRGYSFSDLSGKIEGPGFFPHIFDFSIEPASNGRQGSSRLIVSIRGKWTTRGLPRWVGLCWFRLVCQEHARLLKGALERKVIRDVP